VGVIDERVYERERIDEEEKVWGLNLYPTHRL